MSNMVGAILARNTHRPEGRNAGFHGPPMTMYASCLCHYSLPKNAGMIGIGRDNVRKIETDARGRMRPDALRTQITKDRDAGLDPFLIVATAGTTVLGAFDPIDEIADVADEFGLRLPRGRRARWQCRLQRAPSRSAARQRTRAFVHLGTRTRCWACPWPRR